MTDVAASIKIQEALDHFDNSHNKVQELFKSLQKIHRDQSRLKEKKTLPYPSRQFACIKYFQCKPNSSFHGVFFLIVPVLKLATVWSVFSIYSSSMCFCFADSGAVQCEHKSVARFHTAGEPPVMPAFHAQKLTLANVLLKI